VRAVNEDIIMIYRTPPPLQEHPSLRGLLLALAALLTLSGVIGLFAALSYKDTKRIVPGNERITSDHVFNGTFAASKTELSWVPEGRLPKLVTLVIVELTCVVTAAAAAATNYYDAPFTKKPVMVSFLSITMVSSSS
jgi:hypothetical protein